MSLSGFSAPSAQQTAQQGAQALLCCFALPGVVMVLSCFQPYPSVAGIQLAQEGVLEKAG